MQLPFFKYHGLGNDFAVIDARQLTIDLSGRLGAALCDRFRGIGADGLLLWRGTSALPEMVVVNADGSIADMCGNGLRCFVKHVAEAEMRGRPHVDVLTGSGVLPCALTWDAHGRVASVAVQMGVASYDPDVIPLAPGAALAQSPVEVDGAVVHLTALKLGNPHAVTFDALPTDVRLAVGPVLERHPLFPRRANIEFADITSVQPPRMVLHVFERGCGWTQACGTGATAATIAAVDSGRLPRGEEVSVRLPGGELGITVAAGGMATMRGPATFVYQGVVDTDDVATHTAD